MKAKGLLHDEKSGSYKNQALLFSFPASAGRNKLVWLFRQYNCEPARSAFLFYKGFRQRAKNRTPGAGSPSSLICKALDAFGAVSGRDSFLHGFSASRASR